MLQPGKPGRKSECAGGEGETAPGEEVAFTTGTPSTPLAQAAASDLCFGAFQGAANPSAHTLPLPCLCCARSRDGKEFLSASV